MRERDDPAPERRLLAAVLLRAYDDVRYYVAEPRGGADDAVAAYLWVTNQHPLCRLFCEHLGIDAGYFRARFVALFADGMAPALQQRAAEVAAARARQLDEKQLAQRRLAELQEKASWMREYRAKRKRERERENLRAYRERQKRLKMGVRAWCARRSEPR